MEDKMKDLNNEQLINIIKDHETYPEKTVESASALLLEREVISEEEIEAFKEARDIEEESGIDIDENKLQEYLTSLKQEENFARAIVAGIVSSIVAALLWAVITVVTGYQIGYIAIAVGFIVGFSVRFAGKGLSQKFGIVGALFALLACVLGNLFAIFGFLMQENGASISEVYPLLNFDMIVTLLEVTFNPMDLLFYGFALFEGYKFSFRQITDEEIIANAKAAGSAE